MRTVAWVFAFASLLVGADASAYARVPRAGAFGAFLTDVGVAARRHDMRALRRLTDREFTVGEELGRDESLAVLDRDAAMRQWLATITDHGVCYRTDRELVQCELDHTKQRRSIAIFEHTRHGWRMNAFYA